MLALRLSNFVSYQTGRASSQIFRTAGHWAREQFREATHRYDEDGVLCLSKGFKSVGWKEAEDWPRARGAL